MFGGGMSHRALLLSASALAISLTIGNASAQEEDVVLDAVVLSGERVERTVFETASSVEVVTGEDLEETPALQNLEDVLEDIPNIIVFGGGNEAPVIRGQSTSGPLEGGSQILSGTVPRASTSIDGRLLSPNEFIFGTNSVYDVEAVEVFRGPQTTTQGANAIAGAIFIRTKDPTYEYEAEGRTQFQSFDGRQFSGFVNAPLIEDQLAVRLTGDFRRRDNFITFPDFASPTDESLRILQGTGRAKILFEPKALPDLSTKLTFSLTRTSGPQSENVTPPFGALTNTFIGPGETVAVFETDSFSVIHDIEYDVSSNLTLSNRVTASWIGIDRFLNTPDGQFDLDSTDITNETLATYEVFDGRLTGVAGVFTRFTDETSEFFIGLPFGLGSVAFDDQRNSFGVFGEATFQATDKLDLTAGLRYQRDSQDRIGEGAAALTLFPAGSDLSFDGTFDAFLPKFAAGYDVSDNVRLGAVVSRGFNPGASSIGVNSLFALLPEAVFAFGEERLWNYEAFVRANLFDDRLELTANAFFTDFEDLQVNVPTLVPPGLTDTIVLNAEDARSYGLELAASALVLDNLEVNVAIGLLETEFLEFTATTSDVIGNEFINAPSFTGTLGADWEVIDHLKLGVKARYNSDYFNDPENTDAARIDGFAIVDLKASYEPTENFEAFAFVNNVFDVVEPVILFGGGSIGRTTVPREFGGGLRVRF